MATTKKTSRRPRNPSEPRVGPSDPAHDAVVAKLLRGTRMVSMLEVFYLKSCGVREGHNCKGVYVVTVAPMMDLSSKKPVPIDDPEADFQRREKVRRAAEAAATILGAQWHVVVIPSQVAQIPPKAARVALR